MVVASLGEAGAAVVHTVFDQRLIHIHKLMPPRELDPPPPVLQHPGMLVKPRRLPKAIAAQQYRGHVDEIPRAELRKQTARWPGRRVKFVGEPSPLGHP